MIKDIQSTLYNPIKAYIGNNLVWSKQADTPKVIYADFVSNNYSIDNSQSTFDDLFIFNRDSKAWLIVDAGLQEYQINEPRFNEGLLIEPEATNYHYPSHNMSYGNFTDVTFLPSDTPDRLNPDDIKIGSYGTTSARFEYTVPTEIYNKPMSVSFHTLANKNIPRVIPRVHTQSVNRDTDLFSVDTGVVYNTQNIKRHYTEIQTVESPTSRPAWRFYFAFDREEVEGIAFWGWQVEEGVMSSYIPTIDSSVTRKADLLISKYQLAAISGQWDDTLNITLNKGQLVITGIGKIYNLELTIKENL